MDGYSLYSDFDFEKHKKTFINYFEVIIKPSGKVCYAMPSHSEFLLKLLKDQTGETKKQIYERIPPDYWFDTVKWMCEETGCVAAWTGYIVKPKNMTRFQKAALKKAFDIGIFKSKWTIEELES